MAIPQCFKLFFINIFCNCQVNSHPKIVVYAAFPILAELGLEDDIVLYIVVKPGQTLDERELRGWIETEMPKYMRPKPIRFIETLPQTATNKIEKYKLKELFLNESI